MVAATETKPNESKAYSTRCIDAMPDVNASAKRIMENQVRLAHDTIESWLGSRAAGLAVRRKARPTLPACDSKG